MVSLAMIVGYADIIPHFVRGTQNSFVQGLEDYTSMASWQSVLFPLATTKNDAWFVSDLSLRDSYIGLPFLVFFLLSLFSQTCAISIMFLIGRYSTLGPEIPFNTYFLVTPIGFMATAIPISPAGVGVGQAAFDFLFNLYLGYQSQIGALVITVYQLLTLLFGLVGAYFYLVKSKKKDSLDTMELELINSK